LEKEQFQAFPELCSRMRQRLLDVVRVLNPVLDELHYSEGGQKIMKSKQVGR
jgi:aspartate oxidase